MGQGILGTPAALSCIYVPTNVYTAWRCVVDRPNCEREFALEGVTHLEGAPHGEYIHHIPGSLAIESSKLEFWQSVQPKPGAGDIAIES